MSDCFVFGAVRGIQNGRESFVAMCPFRQIPRSFLFAEEELPSELEPSETSGPSSKHPT